MSARVQRRSLLVGSAALAVSGASRARAQGRTLRIGVLNDLNGPYSESAGRGSVLATQMAVDDFNASHSPALPVEVLSADMQNKPDIASSIARNWYAEQGVDAISDVPQSAAALAVSTIVAAQDKVLLLGGPGAMDFTGKACNANTVQTTFDTYSVCAGTCRTVLAEGGDSWYFLTPDYLFGASLEASAKGFILPGGGKVLGVSRYPFPETTDFSSYLLQADASKAKVVGLLMGGGDMTGCLKQCAEFNIRRNGRSLAAMIMLIGDIHAAGLEVAQGVIHSSSFYWDANEGSRAFSKRFAAKYDGRMPSQLHAGAYSGAMHYLKAVAALGIDRAKASGRAVVDQMKAMPSEDIAFGHGSFRVDGRMLHPMYVLQVKTPAESKGPWDYCKVLQVLPGEQVTRALQTDCPLVRA